MDKQLESNPAPAPREKPSPESEIEVLEREVADLQINGRLLQIEECIRREYLAVLDQASIEPLSPEQMEINPGSNMEFMRIDSFTYDEEESLAQKLRSVFGSLERAGTTSALLLDGQKDSIDLYLGVFTDDVSNKAGQYRLLASAFNGVFPGCRFRRIHGTDGDELLNKLLNPSVPTSVAAVSAFPFVQEEKREKEKHPSGLDELVDGMRGKPFAMLLLAQSIEKSELVAERQILESMYTQIAPLQKRDISLSENLSETLGVNYSRSLAKSLSISTGMNFGRSYTTGTNRGVQTGPDTKSQRKYAAITQLAGLAAGAAVLATGGLSAVAAGGAAAAAAGGVSAVAAKGAAGALAQGLYFTANAFSGILGNVSTLVGAAPEPDRTSVSEGSHEDKGINSSINKNESVSDSQTITIGDSTSTGKSSGKSVQLSFTNKSVAGLLERIDSRIKEITKLENEGAFMTAAYFIAGDEETACTAANMYRAQIMSQSTPSMRSPVYCWSGENSNLIRQYLQRGMHPVLSFANIPDYPIVSPAQPIGIADMATYIDFPRKSVNGVNVTTHAAFARNVLPRDGEEITQEKMLRLGCLHHMGKDVPQDEVTIGQETLASHLFVAGATGSGKSNFCYTLIDRVLDRGIKIMIIEPAKGEYSRVFGGRTDFRVYGTNLRQAMPLRINPFAFPEGISAQEHIDTLLSIFCAAWPMYSAMPAIMKDALTEIYRLHGFEDLWGDVTSEADFPCFQDLLEVLPVIIKSSNYSAEVQGNYIGALTTRVKSMTNGIYSVMFGGEEIGDKELFDENTIVDISRVGSEETKALIMGMLIMRLQEYRRVSGLMNSPLRHITLLEEAHHLLGTHAAPQGQDVSNISGASVQMISNAIREMRTYGDGFIIADQSPAVMDPTVISNAHTKVFFMLPRREDMQIAGNSLSLNDKQIAEIAKLQRGVSIIYQNEWSDAVLCRIDYYNPDKYKAFHYDASNLRENAKKLLRSAVLCMLPNHDAKELAEQALCPEVRKSGFALGAAQKDVFRILEDAAKGKKEVDYSLKERSQLLDRLLGISDLLIRYQSVDEIAEWDRQISRYLWMKAAFNEVEIQQIITVTLLFRAENQNKRFSKFYQDYITFKFGDN